MILFKEVTPEDKDIIFPFIMNSARQNCELSFSNLCSWKFLYNTRFAVIDHFLTFKSWAGDRLTYMMPIGTGDLKAALQALFDDADKEKQPFRMIGVNNKMRTLLEATFPERFIFMENRDFADYIYLRSDLATLRGKKFQPKRNHINRFRKTYPNYEYIPITQEHIEECMDLEAKWYEANRNNRQEGTSNERQALTYALHHFKVLGLQGGILKVDGQTVAFTFGMPINCDTFGVHVEKADTAVDGAYAMINYEFANHIPQQYIYINREEDLGIEGLRKAKLSYQPTIILTKYIVYLKEQFSAR